MKLLIKWQKNAFDQTPNLTETFDQLKRSSEIRSTDPLSKYLTIWKLFGVTEELWKLKGTQNMTNVVELNNSDIFINLLLIIMGSWSQKALSLTMRNVGKLKFY